MPLVEIIPPKRGIDAIRPRISISIRPHRGASTQRVWLRFNASFMRQLGWEPNMRVHILRDDEAGTVHIKPGVNGRFNLRRKDRVLDGSNPAYDLHFVHPFATESARAETVNWSLQGDTVIIFLPQNVWSAERVTNMDRARDLLRRGVVEADVARQARISIGDVVRLAGELQEERKRFARANAEARALA